LRKAVAAVIGLVREHEIADTFAAGRNRSQEKESSVRIAYLALISAIGLAVAPLSAQAAVSAAAGITGGTSSAIVDVAVNCGPHAHYIRGHRDSHGHYVKGICVRDRRPPPPHR
jgi:hypothetical protein